ncbi:hypothetical protein SeLEV6574_g02223 [Synchytrium endobioticum]|uniref:Uncharacterized protein n=1 Tax=Synchytrium endobioticum TaxID=286115 RepID=A0A507D9L0_9FUNG|nr:hypothetical protein SeLEV6574_g02223 [Synchytrium endobioticum]
MVSGTSTIDDPPYFQIPVDNFDYNAIFEEAPITSIGEWRAELVNKSDCEDNLHIVSPLSNSNLVNPTTSASSASTSSSANTIHRQNHLWFRHPRRYEAYPGSRRNTSHSAISPDMSGPDADLPNHQPTLVESPIDSFRWRRLVRPSLVVPSALSVHLTIGDHDDASSTRRSIRSLVRELRRHMDSDDENGAGNPYGVNDLGYRFGKRRRNGGRDDEVGR